MVMGVILQGLGAFEEILNSWEKVGFFTYLLPFLLLFALVFGILSRMNIFKENKAVNVIIAIVAGLMSLQFKGVSQFFSAIFPRMGIGLIIILVILILAGLFADPDSPMINYVLLGVGVLVAIIVLVQTAGSVGWSAGQWWANNWPMIAGVLVILIFVIVIVSASSQTKEQPPYKGLIFRDK